MTDLASQLGRRFTRVADGVRAKLVLEGDRYLLEYRDRGSTVLLPINSAALTNDWQPADPAPPPLHPDEIARIAAMADNALRACAKHEAFLFYRLADLRGYEPYDTAFVDSITSYLRSWQPPA